jgi:hypothetical protein
VAWVFVVIAAFIVFAIAAATVGREAFRLGHQPPPAIFDVDEAVLVVADALPDEVQARLSYDDVRALVGAELDHLHRKGVFAGEGEDVQVSDADVVVDDDDAVAVVLGAAEAAGLDVTDTDVVLVIDALHAHLADIGAVGPRATGPVDRVDGGGTPGNGAAPGNGTAPADGAAPDPPA